MDAAHIGEGPQPDCAGRPEEFVDYSYSEMPDKELAELLCSRCPLIEVCLKNARHRKPKWGVYGGLVYVDGRQVALMAEDDPRLRDPDLE